MLTPTRLCAAAVALTVLIQDAATAQTPQVTVAGRAQAQYRFASGDASGSFDDEAQNNGFEIRRLRIQADVAIGDRVDIVIQPSFEMGSLRMRDAYVRVGMTPTLGVTLGQRKSPFQRYELQSSNTLPSIERGLRILGLDDREGLNDLLFANGYVSHDLGAFADVLGAGGRWALMVGVQNGSRESARDVNNAKSFFGRITGVAVTDVEGRPLLQLGASLGLRDRAIGTPFIPDSSKMTTAVGLDAEWGRPDAGLRVVADFATGDNVPVGVRVDVGRNSGNLPPNTPEDDIVTFRGFHIVGSYRVPIAGGEERLVQFLDPALRLDITDPDTDTPDDAGLLITPVLNVHFTRTTIMRVGLDLYRYREADETFWARQFTIQWQANF